MAGVVGAGVAGGVVAGAGPISAAALHAVLLHTFTPEAGTRKVGKCLGRPLAAAISRYYSDYTDCVSNQNIGLHQ